MEKKGIKVYFKKKESRGISLIVFISVIVLVGIVSVILLYFLYNGSENQSINSGENIDSIVLGTGQKIIYAKVKDFPSNCSGVEFFFSTKSGEEYFCYMDSTPSTININSSGASEETFDYEIDSECAGLDDFSTVSDIRAVYVPRNTTTQSSVTSTSSTTTSQTTTTTTSEKKEEKKETVCNDDSINVTCGTNGCGIKVNNCDKDVNCGSCSAGYDCASNICVRSTHAYIIESNFINMIYNSSSLKEGVNLSGMGNFPNLSGLIDGASASYYVDGYPNTTISVVVKKFNHTITYSEFNQSYLYTSFVNPATYALSIFSAYTRLGSSGAGYLLDLEENLDDHYHHIWVSGDKIIQLRIDTPDSTFFANVDEDTFVGMIDSYEDKHIANLAFPTLCNDTDGGRNYFDGGSVKTYLEGYVWELDAEGDSCQYNSKILHEKYCEDGKIKSEDSICPIWCFEGACINENKYLRCEDTDNGINYSVQGDTSLVFNSTGIRYESREDYCVDDQGLLHEVYCENDNIIGQEYNCSSEGKTCYEGACVNVTECGDGILDLGEECDDGNLVNDDGCDNSCMIETTTSGPGDVNSYDGDINDAEFGYDGNWDTFTFFSGSGNIYNTWTWRADFAKGVSLKTKYDLSDYECGDINYYCWDYTSGDWTFISKVGYPTAGAGTSTWAIDSNCISGNDIKIKSFMDYTYDQLELYENALVYTAS